MEEAVTAGIRVQVKSFYLEVHSVPEEDLYVFAYKIKITNESDRHVQLLSRHWIITDSNGEVSEVKGDGVIGESPILKPGEKYEYTSGSHLKSPMGTMEGTYRMSASENEFDVTIPCFTLAVPGIIN